MSSLTKSAWNIMKKNNYKSFVHDKKRLWAAFGLAMKRAWMDLKKAATVMVIQAGRALKPIEKATLQRVYGAKTDGVNIDLDAGYLIFPDVQLAERLLSAACCTISNFERYFCDGLYWLDESENDGVAEICDELRELPCNGG